MAKAKNRTITPAKAKSHDESLKLVHMKAGKSNSHDASLNSAGDGKKPENSSSHDANLIPSEAWVAGDHATACIRIGMACVNNDALQPGVIEAVLDDAVRVRNSDGTLTTARLEQVTVPPRGSLAARSIIQTTPETLKNTPAENETLAARLSDVFAGLVALVPATSAEGTPEQIAAAIAKDLGELRVIREAKAKADAEEGEDTVPLDPLRFLTLCRQIEKMLYDAHFTELVDGKEEDRLDVAVDGVVVRPWYFACNPWRCVEEFACDLRGEAEDMLGFAHSQLVKQKLEGKKIAPAPAENAEGGGDSFYMARRKMCEAVIEAEIALDLWEESQPGKVKQFGKHVELMEQVRSAFESADSALTSLSDHYVEDEIYAARLIGGAE